MSRAAETAARVVTGALLLCFALGALHQWLSQPNRLDVTDIILGGCATALVASVNFMILGTLGWVCGPSRVGLAIFAAIALVAVGLEVAVIAPKLRLGEIADRLMHGQRCSLLIYDAPEGGNSRHLYWFLPKEQRGRVDGRGECVPDAAIAAPLARGVL